jgi:hypothetical protein
MSTEQQDLGEATLQYYGGKHKMNWITAFFKKKPKKTLSDQKITLPSGTAIQLYKLANWMIRDAEQKATIGSGILNNAVYFAVIENHILPLTKDDIDQLSPRDSNAIRQVVKRILEEEGMIEPEKKETPKNSDFSPEEAEWFEKTRSDALQRMKTGKL